jgi:hypothetical protein
MKLLKLAAIGLVCLALPVVAQYKGGAVSNGGSISGVVKIKGKAPKDPMLTVNADQKFCGDKIAAEHYVISAKGEIQNAVVMIDGIKKGAKLDKKKKTFMDNVKCRNEPRVLVAPKGGTIEYKNSDPIAHTAHFYLMKKGKKKDLINKPMPKKDMVIKEKKPLRKAGLVSLLCDPHTFEQGWVMVLDNPYGAVSDAKGAFKLENVPAGKHKIKVWHEMLGEKMIDVTVKAGADTKVTVELSAK